VFQHSPISTVAPGVVEHAVFGFDRWLRQRQGVYEYSDDPRCFFRVQRMTAERDVALGDGRRIGRGTPVLNLHLWNEHVPPLGSNGFGIAWAREATRRVELSMYGLPRHLKWARALHELVALRGDMRLGTAEQSDQLARIAVRYGFEAAGADPDQLSAGTLTRLAQNVFICLPVLAPSPAALRLPVLRRYHKLVYLSRSALETRYALAAMLGCKRAGD
jgi:hypothetical protein